MDIIGTKVVILMLRRSRRTREEITYEILMILKAMYGVPISSIMQKARLNYYQAKNYLTNLADKGYVAEKNDIYILLHRGREFITRHEALKALGKT